MFRTLVTKIVSPAHKEIGGSEAIFAICYSSFGLKGCRHRLEGWVLSIEFVQQQLRNCIQRGEYIKASGCDGFKISDPSFAVVQEEL